MTLDRKLAWALVLITIILWAAIYIRIATF